VNENTWTWMSGMNPSVARGKYGEKGKAHVENFSVIRSHAAGFYESSTQEFWLFGGIVNKGVSETSGMQCNHSIRIEQFTKINLARKLNDLWKYRLNDGTWTWISGSDTIDALGIYGSKGNASAENVPGSRYGAVGWYDRLRQEFWVFGGYGISANSLQGTEI